MVILCRRSYCGVSIRLLALIVTIEERHDLGSRAVVAGAEQAAADAAGDAVLGGPCHRVGVIGVGRHIAKLGGAADRRAARRAVQEGHALCAGAGDVDTEDTIGQTVGDAVFQCPDHRITAIAAGEHIGRSLSRALGGGRTGGPPQEGDDLTAGAGIIGTEQTLSLTVGDAALHGPFHGIVVV